MQYELRIEAADAEGRTVRTAQTISSDSTAGNFLLRTNKAVYNGGDTLRLTALQVASQC